MLPTYLLPIIALVSLTLLPIVPSSHLHTGGVAANPPSWPKGPFPVPEPEKKREEEGAEKDEKEYRVLNPNTEAEKKDVVFVDNPTGNPIVEGEAWDYLPSRKFDYNNEYEYDYNRGAHNDHMPPHNRHMNGNKAPFPPPSPPSYSSSASPVGLVGARREVHMASLVGSSSIRPAVPIVPPRDNVSSHPGEIPSFPLNPINESNSSSSLSSSGNGGAGSNYPTGGGGNSSHSSHGHGSSASGDNDGKVDNVIVPTCCEDWCRGISHYVYQRCSPFAECVRLSNSSFQSILFPNLTLSECQCMTGYDGDGLYCEVTSCEHVGPNPCGEDQVCVIYPSFAAFTCLCTYLGGKTVNDTCDHVQPEPPEEQPPATEDNVLYALALSMGLFVLSLFLGFIASQSPSSKGSSLKQNEFKKSSKTSDNVNHQATCANESVVDVDNSRSVESSFIEKSDTDLLKTDAVESHV
eukprot:Nk52_evm37s2579 gene=Nk52_evmTU37s2579